MKSPIALAAIALTIVLAVLAAMQADRQDTVAGPVEYVRGGDTVRVDNVSVRLNGVAVPDRREPVGAEAENFLKNLVTGKTVSCRVSSQRSYDRRIGTCYLDGTDLAVLIIGAGLARDCPRHSGGRYSDFNTAASKQLPLPDFCQPR
ncbi:MAG: thermonuclease family protein [Alphaproteobacteria bacterium]|nr:thermonuclease family protein [Alphaproteobacteria bacterium]